MPVSPLSRSSSPVIEKTRCDGCHGNTPATTWSDLSGCFGTSGSHDDVWQREEKGRKSGGMSVQISDTCRTVSSSELFLHELEQDCQIEEETLVKKKFLFLGGLFIRGNLTCSGFVTLASHSHSCRFSQSPVPSSSGLWRALGFKLLTSFTRFPKPFYDFNVQQSSFSNSLPRCV